MERLNFTKSSSISSKSSFTNTTLVRQSLESMLGSRRRSKKEISVLHWGFRNNCLSPELFKDIQDAISLIHHYRTRWWFRADSSITFTILDVRLIFILSSTIDWYLEVRIQAGDSILLAHWSKRQRSSRSWTYWLLSTTSSTVRTQYMEEPSRRGILGRY